MSGCAFHQGRVISDSGLLRSAGNTIDICDKGNHRLARTVGGHPSGGDGSDASFHVKAVLLQDARHVAGGLHLLEAEFAEAEDFVHHLLREDL